MSFFGPQDEFCDKIHAEKYRAPNESFRDAMTRTASALFDNEAHFKSLRDILLNMRFLPGGRIQASIGSTRITTPYNCFVSGTIEDSFIDGSGSIMRRAGEAAQTMRLGGGIGYDFSTLRPRGSMIKKLQSSSSGPVSFMEIFDAVCRATCSAGHRRGAQMGILRVDHPDIEEFIRAKQNSDHLTGFNISVAITDPFMEAVKADTDFPLTWGGTVYRTIRARLLWDTLMRSTYDWAEPGVIFIDTINKANNLNYVETIAATNPCGEQPLPPFGACLLGSFNLVKYLHKEGVKGPYRFNWTQFFLDIPHVVRAMDNVVDRAIYPMFEQEQEAQSKRRMGLGVTGVANTVEALGSAYGTNTFNGHLKRILSSLANEAYRASAVLAKEKGPFKLYQAARFNIQPFVQQLDEEVQDLIEQNGIRNSHLLSIAPTGTISISADNVSSGIEPVFAKEVKRTVIEFSGPKVYTLQDYGWKFLKVEPRTAMSVSVKEHLGVLATASQWVDSAVSKTCNVPTDCDFGEFKDIYMQAWEAGCKGCTTYRVGGKREGILQDTSDLQAAVLTDTDSCQFDPITGRKSCE